MGTAMADDYPQNVYVFPDVFLLVTFCFSTVDAVMFCLYRKVCDYGHVVLLASLACL